MNVEYYGGWRTSIESCFASLSIIAAGSPYKKIGVINWWWLSEEESRLENLRKFLESCDICFFISEETLQRFPSIDINLVFELLNNYNVHYIFFFEDANLSVKPLKEKSFYSPWFFKSPLYIDDQFSPDLDYVEKQYTFNLMLGSLKSYRTVVYKLLKDNKGVYSSYLGHPKFKNDLHNNLDEEEIRNDLISQDVTSEKLNTMHHLIKGPVAYPISHVVPVPVYNNTHFDIVTETFIKQDTLFVTEKTAKPLATGRFFCWYNSNNISSYLERYGFDFTHYLTEQYDKFSNDVDRLDGLISVIEEISNNKLFIKDIYEKTRHVRIHNMEKYKTCNKQFYNDLMLWMAECLQK